MSRCLRSRRCARPAAVLAIVAAALSAGCARQGKEAERLLAASAAAYRGLHSFSETTTVRSSSGPSTSTTKTSFDYRAPNKIRYERTGDNPRLWVCDGQKLITFDPTRQVYREREAPADLSAFLRFTRPHSPGISELGLIVDPGWEGLLARPRLGKSEPVEGADTQSVIGDITALSGGRAGGVEGQQTLWLDTETHMIRRNRVVIRIGNQTSQWDEVMHEVKTNPDLPDDRFRWSPPPGVRMEPTSAPGRGPRS